jgi:Cu/Ag efflux protein CusF
MAGVHPGCAWRPLIAVALIAALAGFLPASAQTGRRWKSAATIVALMPPPSALHATRPVVILDHEPIPGLMEEKMSMAFVAASTDLFRGLSPGDHVTFELEDVPGALLVVTLARVPGSTPGWPSRAR